MTRPTLADQLKASILAVNLKQARKLRILTPSERSLLEHSEAGGGELLARAEAYLAKQEAR